MRSGFNGDELPTAVGSVLGFRQFRVSPLGHLLPLSTGHSAWSREENTARCELGYHHAAPMIHCMCGFYAYHEISYALTCAGSRRPCGIIEAYGKVLVGTIGFRAQKAKITMLCSDVPLMGRYRGIQRVEFVDLLEALRKQGRPY